MGAYFLTAKLGDKNIENHCEGKTEVLRHGIFSYFGHVQNSPLNKTKPENFSSLRRKNTKGIIMNHDGTRLAKDGKDWHGLQMENMKTLG